MESLKILVTGGSGYIGRHLLENIVIFFSGRLDIEFSILVVDPSSANCIDYKDIVYCNTKISEAGETIRKFDPTHVFHLASHSVVRHGDYDSCEYYNNNVGETAFLLKSLSSLPRFVFASSCTVYGKNNLRGVVFECTDTEPTSVYGKSKLMCEQMIADAYKYDDSKVRTLFSGYSLLRFFNVCGGGEPNGVEKDRLIPKAIKFAEEGKAFPLYGNMNNIRDYINVYDLVYQMIIIAFAEDPHKTYCLGTGTGHSVKEVLDIVCKVVGKPLEMDYTVGMCASEAGKVICMPSRIDEYMKTIRQRSNRLDEFNYRPLEVSIEQAYEHYKRSIGMDS